MRTVEEIKADVEEAVGLECLGADHKDIADLHNELILSVTNGIPLDRLREICTAEREERCAVMPCKVGSTIFLHRYSLSQNKKIVAEGKCTAIKAFSEGVSIDIMANGMITTRELGLSAFTTREAAESKLRKDTK